jgi:carboxyl-terminal processing protease
MKASTWVVALAPSAVVALAVALVWDRMSLADARAAESTFWDPTVVEFVRGRVAESYVDPLPREKTTELFYSALRAYVGGLDPYSDFLPPDEFRVWTELHAGHYAGVGVRIQRSPEGLRIVGVLPDGPAARAGIAIGDVVTAVEGRSLAGAEVRDEAVQLLKGPEGSRVTVTVQSPPSGDEPEAARPAARDVSLVRAEIRPPTVFARRIGEGGSVAHLRLTEFVDTTDEGLDQHLDRMLADGARSVVLDLRGNGGGTMTACVRVADRFLRSGDIARTVGRTRDAVQSHVAEDAGTIPDDVGLVVLVDGHSASASELLAGAVQDHRRGVLVGTRTHGKFLVQSVMTVPGKQAGLRLTTARYVTPLGRWFRRTSKDPDVPQGIVPDVVVPLDAKEQRRLRESWANEEDAAWGEPPRYDVPADWVDPQVRRALAILEGGVALGDVLPATASTSDG